MLFPFQHSPSWDTFFAATTCWVLEVAKEFFANGVVVVDVVELFVLVRPDAVVALLWLGATELGEFNVKPLN